MAQSDTSEVKALASTGADLFKIGRGLEPEERELAARLFWEAFSGKLHLVLGPDVKAIRYLARSLRLDQALCARTAAGHLVGVAGLKTGTGGLLGGSWRDLADVYGPLGAIWRSPLLDLTTRAVAPRQLVLDGLFVDRTVRGKGAGSALIEEVLAEARRLNLSEVRLDVVESNPRAQALYRRHGFRWVRRSAMGPLHWLFGFRALDQMVRSATADTPVASTPERA